MALGYTIAMPSIKPQQKKIILIVSAFLTPVLILGVYVLSIVWRAEFVRRKGRAEHVLKDIHFLPPDDYFSARVQIDDLLDRKKDLSNNAIGRKIGAHAKAMSLQGKNAELYIAESCFDAAALIFESND